MKSAVIWLIASSILCLSGLVGLSRLYEYEDPVLASLVFPLNTEATVRRTAWAISGNAPKPELVVDKARVENALRFDRIDSRLYSLLGEIETRLGNTSRAALYFDRSARLSRTDLLSLQHRIAGAIIANATDDAMTDVDVLLRRWPNELQQITPLLVALLGTPAGFEAILSSLASTPPWRLGFVSKVARNPDTAAGAATLLLRLHGRSPLTAGEITVALSALLANKHYADAYRFFLFTLTEEQRKLGGFVFNSKFLPVSTNRPFDWQLLRHSGVELSGVLGPGSLPDSGLSLRFLGTPIKSTGVQQYVQLPRGDYRLVLTASARDLKLPKGLFWSLTCVDSKAPLGRLEVSPGNYERKSIQAEIVVPPACPSQILRLQTDLVAQSWRHRYTGQIEMFELRAERVHP